MKSVNQSVDEDLNSLEVQESTECENQLFRN